MASKRRNMFYENKKQETTEIEKTILRGISGEFKSGEFAAILGPSGSGKTTLLNAISGFRTSGVTGQLTVNGRTRDEANFRRSSCYLMQEDSLQPFLSLEELLFHVATLKLPRHYTGKQKKAVVEEIITSFGLEGCRDQRTESLSGGQRRRLYVAMELVDNPPVIFLDEPTTGLDNVSAGSILRLLQHVAHQGRTVICTIHQPSAKHFRYFDRVYVVGKGKCIYHGSTDHLVPFLSSAGLPCPINHNPADFIIEMADESHKNIELLSREIKNGKAQRITGTPSYVCGVSSFKGDIGKERLEERILRYTEGETSCIKRMCTELNMSYWFQFIALLSRMQLQTWRQKIALIIQLVHHIGCGVVIGLMFWGLAKDASQFFNHMKFAMGIVIFHAYTHLMVPILGYPFEIKLVKKEHFNQWYSIGPYFMALTIVKIPTMVALSVVFSCIVYFSSGLPLEMVRLIAFCFSNVLIAFIADSLGLTIGSIFSVTNGAAIGPMSLAPLLGFAIYGFDFAKRISTVWRTVMRTSFLRSAVVANVLVMFGMGRSELECYDPMYCHFKDPMTTLRYLDIDQVSLALEIMWMIVFFVTFRLAFFFALVFRFWLH